MAATVSVWSKPGAWALDSEENEAELLQQKKEASPVVAETSDFPSLSMAASKKAKKKKGQTMSLGELSSYTQPPKVSAYQPKVFTPDEQIVLPKGPRERTQEELDQSRSNGFRSYMRDDQGQGRRQNGGFNRDSDREFQPSRADETNDWGAAKKFSASSNGFERRDRGFFPDSQSRAEDDGDWTSRKSFVPSEPRRSERRSGFGFDNNHSGVADEGNWTGRKNVGAFDSLRDRRGGFESNREESIGTGGERPKLKLQPRTLPVAEVQRIDVKPVEKEKDEIAVTVKPKSNPFGAARPREDVLKEKGQDWKEIDQKLEATKLKESLDRSSFARRGYFPGKDRVQQDNRAWRRPGSSDSRPQSSAGGSENGTVASESGHANAAGEGETLVLK